MGGQFGVLFFVLGITGLVYFYTQTTSPKYEAEAQVLIEAQETAFTRPEVQQGDSVPSIDDRAVTSQVQVMRSRDVAEQVIDRLGLRDDPRFDSALDGMARCSRSWSFSGFPKTRCCCRPRSVSTKSSTAA